jgi:sporulation protein YlmC with PRC-barrel domain
VTETSATPPGTHDPLILERLSDLKEQCEYLAHYPDIRGWLVVNPNDDEVGVVDDLYVNPRKRRVEMAAISFSNAVGYGGKRILVPVEEVKVSEGRVRIMTHSEKIRLAPEFHESVPTYEPYYEYWGSALVGYTEEPEQGVIRPPGPVEIEGVDEDIPRRGS